MKLQPITTKPLKTVDNQDVASFIRWLLEDHFLLIGLRHVDANGTERQALGSARLENSLQMLKGNGGQEELRLNINPHISLRKTGKSSWLYRRGQVDFLTLKLPGDTGEEFFEIEGSLYLPRTSRDECDDSLPRPARGRTFQKYEVSEGTHRYRSIRNAYNSLPIEYLFELPLNDLQQVIEQMVEGESLVKLKFTQHRPTKRPLSSSFFRRTTIRKTSGTMFKSFYANALSPVAATPEPSHPTAIRWASISSLPG